VARDETTDTARWHAACALALAVRAAGKDSAKTEEERKQRAEDYSVKAVELLDRLQAAGYFKNKANRDRLDKATDLDPLRGQPRFARFMEKVR
jgi:hypothetical protein